MGEVRLELDLHMDRIWVTGGKERTAQVKVGRCSRGQMRKWSADCGLRFWMMRSDCNGGKRVQSVGNRALSQVLEQDQELSDPLLLEAMSGWEQADRKRKESAESEKPVGKHPCDGNREKAAPKVEAKIQGGRVVVSHFKGESIVFSG